MQQPAAAARHDDAATTIKDSRLGRLGAWAADHRRAIVIAWCGVVLVLGALAPFADRALSGAGWEALGSESVAARRALEAGFPGRGTYALSVVVAGPRAGVADPTVERVQAVLRGDPAVSGVLPAQDVPGRQHCGRRRPGGCGSERDGRSGRQAQGSPVAAVDTRSRGPPDGARRDVVGLQRRQQGGDAQVRGAVLAAHPRAAAVRLRDAGRGRAAAAADDGRPPRRRRAAVRGRAVRRRLDLGHELRADVRDRARDRLRALHRRPLPLGARGGPGAARSDRAHDGDRGQGRA